MKLRWLSLLAVLLTALSMRSMDKGLNLPPTQGTTRDGAFFPGLYTYDYNPDQVTRAMDSAGFTAIRLGVNVETANNVDALQRHKAYLDAVGGRGIICMFDTSLAPGTSWPRTGNLTGKVEKVAEAWRNIHSVFAPYGENVMYELFNEPWGYQGNVLAYLVDMKRVMDLAKLPKNRCILAGLYGSADVQSLARAGWDGYMAYHVYTFWLPEGNRTRRQFAKRIQQDLAGVSSKVFITEFGTGLDGLQFNIDEDETQQDVVRYENGDSITSDWQREHPDTYVRNICAQYPHSRWCRKRLRGTKGLRGTLLAQGPKNLGADVVAQTNTDPIADAAKLQLIYQKENLAFLHGLRDALMAFKKQNVGLKGLYHWHGWHNGDTWDFWDAANARSSRLIQAMMVDLTETSASNVSDPFEDADAFQSEDFPRDEQSVHMMIVRHLDPQRSMKCPEECSVKSCQAGNAGEIGGRKTTGNFCTFNCSVPFNGVRFCGEGALYATVGSFDCSGCAKPARCAGLPCWSAQPDKRKAATAARIVNGLPEYQE